MYYDCCLFETIGFLCAHMVRVCQYVAESCDQTFVGLLTEILLFNGFLHTCILHTSIQLQEYLKGL